jgi:hypothetical protein
MKYIEKLESLAGYLFYNSPALSLSDSEFETAKNLKASMKD